jgi:AraC family transcriptional regulator of adaptative response / DNA-3-methyladenine glycosylase II
MRALTGGFSPASPPPASTAARCVPCAHPGARTAASSRWPPRPRARVSALPALPPELAPQALAWSVQDASGMLVQQAAAPAGCPRREAWATARACHRGPAGRAPGRERPAPAPHFRGGAGVSPLQYLQTRRLLTAKQLLTDTLARHAGGAGQWLWQRAALQRCVCAALWPQPHPAAPRGRRRPRACRPATLRLAYRPPLDVPACWPFLPSASFTGWSGQADAAPRPAPHRAAASPRSGRLQDH